MCDKSAFRSGREEPIPKPRTAEELLELAQKKKRKEDPEPERDWVW